MCSRFCPSCCHSPPGSLEFPPRARPISNFPTLAFLPRPSRMSPVSAGAPSSAVAMTTWPLRWALLGKAVWASPATVSGCPFLSFLVGRLWSHCARHPTQSQKPSCCLGYCSFLPQILIDHLLGARPENSGRLLSCPTVCTCRRLVACGSWGSCRCGFHREGRLCCPQGSAPSRDRVVRAGMDGVSPPYLG